MVDARSNGTVVVMVKGGQGLDVRWNLEVSVLYFRMVI